MASNTIKGLKVEIGGDTTKLGEALENVQKKSKSLSGELGQINRLLKMDPGNTDLLAQKQKVLASAIENTAKKLETLKTAEKQVQQQFEKGKVSEEQVRELQREIIATEKKMDSYKNAAKETEQALRGVGDESKRTEDASRNLGETLANAAKVGFAAVTAVAAAAVTGLVAAAESTREYRTEMGKLDTAFTTAGHSSEAAKNTYQELQSILGETDQAVEASNHLAKLCKNEDDLKKMTEAATGVYAVFGDSLPIENLTEAANETAKTGAITGGLADALNWAGVSEDDFQAKLDKCSSEQERQALIIDTLNGLYSDAATKYRETNAEVIRANEANEQWMQSLAGIGGAIEPIITDVKMLGASLLSEAVPGIKAMAEAFRGMMNGEEGVGANFGAALSGLVTGLVTKITEALPTIATVGFNIISTLATSLLQQIPTLLTTAGQIVTQLVTGITTYLPTIVSKGAELLGKLGEGIKTGLPNIVSQGLDILMKFAQSLYDNAPTLIEAGIGFIKNLVQGILNSIPTLISKAPEIISKFANIINDNAPRLLKGGFELIVQIVKGIISAIPTLIANIPKIIRAIVDVWEAFNWLSLGKKAITLLKNGITSMWGAIKSAGKGVMDACTGALKNLPSNLMKLGKSAVSGLGNALRNGWSTVKAGAVSIFNGIVNFFKTLPQKMLSIGKDIVKGLWNGISDMTGWVIGKIQGFGESVLGGIKKFFGIKSPSTVMRDEVGKQLSAGMAEGITDNAKVATSAMASLSQGIMDATDVGGLSFERSLARSTRSGGATGAGVATLTPDNSALLAKLDAIYERMDRLQVVLDSGATVGGLLDKIDAGLASKQALYARGV